MERRVWLAQLPQLIRDAQHRWSLSLGPPFAGATCAWVAPATRSDGTRAVLKLGMPHMEAAHELHGLRFWNGDAMVRLLEADERTNAMLLEMCEPGTALREVPEVEQDVIMAKLLRRLWRVPTEPHRFPPLSALTASWALETTAASAKWPDRGLVSEGLRVFRQLSLDAVDGVLLATDLHAGNVLRAQREPWLAIDPKPFVGDRAYDATQHLLNCPARMSSAPLDTIRRFADLAAIDAERVRRWMFARAAAGPREVWAVESLALARALA